MRNPIPQLKDFRSTARHRHGVKNRGGFALIMCLVVAAVCSLMVIGIFNTLKLESRETRAYEDLAISKRIVQSASERAIAELMRNPTLRNELKVPASLTPSGTTIQAKVFIVENSGTLSITSSAITPTHSAGVTTNVQHQYQISVAELQQRRQQMGL